MSTEAPARHTPVTTAPPARRARIDDRLRTRRLAGDRRTGSWARYEARRACWDFARNNRWLLASMTASGTIVTAIAAWLMPDRFASGLLVGSGLAMTVFAVAYFVFDTTGVAQLLHGASAETFTAMHLRRLQPHGWRLINHFSLDDHDIDHILIGPAGVIVVETKWSSHDWGANSSSRYLLAAVDQAKDNAHSLHAHLKRFGVDEVRSAALLWSARRPDRSENPPPYTERGCRVIRGAEAASAFRDHLIAEQATLTATQIEQVWDFLITQVQRNDTHIAETSPPLPGLDRLVGIVVGALAAFFTALTISLSLASADTWLWVAGTALQAAVGFMAGRVRAVRPFAYTWLAATAAVSTFVAIVLAVQLA